MRKSILRSALGTLALALGLSRDAAPAEVPAFTADTITTVRGKTLHGKLWASGTRLRTEGEHGGVRATGIVDLARGRMWMLSPSGGCMEAPIGPTLKEQFSFGGTPGRQEALGEETVEGHPARKYRVTTTVDGVERIRHEWRATDLGGLVVKKADARGGHELVLRNVVIGPPDPALLEPPEECAAVEGLVGD